MLSSIFFTEEFRQKLINYSLRKAETHEYLSLGALLDFARRVLDVRLSSNMARNLKRKMERELLKSGYFYELKFDGLIWFTTTTAGRRAYLDLIRGTSSPKQNSNHGENSGFQRYRNIAEWMLDQNIYLTEHHYDKLEDLFSEYLDLVDAKVIMLQHRKDPEKFALMGYKTRFTDDRRRKKLLARYDHAWSYATTHYQNGVFLTLTTDPSQFSSIYEATMSISWAWNSFMSWLQKKLGRRPPYIKVLEFTKKGLPHLHIIFFDVSYIADHFEITEEWNRLGQGRINYVYGIVNTNGNWRWRKRKPQGGGRSVKQYLKKYLLKTMSTNALGTLALYWATNKRFYTTSRVLGKKLRHEHRTGEWEFFGTAWGVELLEVLPWWADVVYSEFGGGYG